MLIYSLPITSERWTKTETKLLKYISVERQAKVSRYIHMSDQKLSLYSGLVARMGVSQMTGIPTSDLQFHSKPNHKPRALTFPHVDFSLSHTKGSILCCFSLDSQVGADIEMVTAAPLEVMDQVFHQKEKEYIKNAPADKTDLHFFKIWTRKEAYTKRIGTGLAYDLCSCNTLGISSEFYTWQQGAYCCSVSGNISKPLKITALTEIEVQNFFFYL